MTVPRIRALAARLTRRLALTTAPVDMDAVAAAVSLPTITEPLAPDIAGALLLTPSGPVACLNARQPAARRRVLLAHLIGHVQLGHRFPAGTAVHVDRNFETLRGERRYTPAEQLDYEANVFAGRLLVPEPALDTALAGLGHRRISDDDIQALADHFGVSVQGMTLRLASVGKI
ncbi:MAG: ImmA/IrrE family metallo-endopeptidase [Vicinamibacterales bacterium]